MYFLPEFHDVIELICGNSQDFSNVAWFCTVSPLTAVRMDRRMVVREHTETDATDADFAHYTITQPPFGFEEGEGPSCHHDRRSH